MHQSSSSRLSVQIVIAIISGLAVGLVLHQFSAASWVHQYLVEGFLDWGGKVFIQVLKMLVVPVVFVSLVCGTFNMGNSSRFGFIAVKTVSLYLFTTVMAISLALLISYLTGIGTSDIPPSSEPSVVIKAPTMKQTLLNIFPANPVAAMAEGNMLQIIFFALLLGIAISASGDKSNKIKQLFREADVVVMQLVHLIFYIAPFGVFCLITVLFAQMGLNLLGNLVGYFLTVVMTLLIHATLVYSLLLIAFTGLSPLVFFRKMWTAMMFAFSTSSSNASIPIVLETAEKKLGIDESIAAFVIPLGATINMDGTTIMQGVATVFIANSYHVPIGVTGYLTVILLATMASIGTAGVPSVGLLTLTMVLTQVGLPIEGIGLIIGIDRLLDMLRTAVNICGDAMIACIVSSTEKSLDKERFNSFERLKAGF